MKKGFTLIELLAVILILGIIALIAIPTVNNIISEARYGAFKSSSDNIMKTVEQTCQASLIKGENPTVSYIFTDGKSNDKIDVKGSLPNDGYIFLDRNCNVENYYLTDNKNVYSNEEDVRNDYMLKASSEEETSIFNELYDSSYFERIKNVYVVKHLNISADAIEIKDPSVSQNGKIKSWLIEDGGKYDLYIGSDKTIYTNYNSSSLFANLYDVKNIYLDNLSTSFSTDLSYFMHDNIILENVDVSKLDIGNAINIECFFDRCYSLKRVNVENWNTSNVVNMKCVFDDCRSLLELNISTWNTSNVKYMDAVFSDLLLVKNLDVSKWDTSNVVSMKYMFDGYDSGSSLKSIDLSSWDTSKLEDISEMFLNINLEKLNITGWNLSNIDVKDNVFMYADKLNYVICSNIETLNVLADLLPSRTSTSIGTIEFKGDKTGINLSDFTDKNWNVI